MDNGNHKSSETAILPLIALAWIASIISLPVYVNALAGMGMSPSSPHGTHGELLNLVAWPVVALVASILALLRRNITAAQGIMAFLPLVLSFCELIVLAIWKAG